MIHKAKFIAADLGASSGRVMVGLWDGRRFSLEELHRFPNGAVQVGASLYWDVLSIWGHLQEGLKKYRARFTDSPDGIGVDGWGVDFGLLDERGRLIGNPFHYRDSRTIGIPERFFELIPERDVYAETGTQTMAINTLFQLYSMVLGVDPQLLNAESLLMIPDLLLYFLSGEKRLEYTEATTTQMYCVAEGNWAEHIIHRAGIPASLLPDVIAPGTVTGPACKSVLRGCGMEKPIPVIAVASHDTASAVAAIPNMDAESAFISSGTWSLVGVEVDAPNLSDPAREQHFTNEGSADGRILLLKNVTGFWILQECMRYWKLQGSELAWAELIHLASVADPLKSLFDPNDSRLQRESSMPSAIQECCRATGQTVPATAADFARSTYESLSLKYRSILEQLEALTLRKITAIRIVGGGALNGFLCQMTADACNRLVVSGPAEASAMGNVMLQAVATGHLESVSAAKAALAESVACTVYEPSPSAKWDEAFQRFKRIAAD